jgi:hypothetical protein
VKSFIGVWIEILIMTEVHTLYIPRFSLKYKIKYIKMLPVIFL